MAVIVQISPSEAARPVVTGRAVLGAILLHALVLAILWWGQSRNLALFNAPTPEPDIVSVDVVIAAPIIAAPSIPEPRGATPQEPESQVPEPQVPEPQVPKPPAVTVAPPPPTPSLPDITPPPVAPVVATPPTSSAAPLELTQSRDAPTSSAVSIAPPSTPAARGYIPSRWALEPPLAKDRLEGLGFADDVDCLRSLSPDCQDLRKAVFAEYQMSEMDKVWTPTRAHSGLPSEFYGLSERDIRLKLGMNIAGENGLVLIPGVLKLDGVIWDAMHGIKEHCTYDRGVKRCPDSLPSADDRKYYIPPTPEP